MIVKIEKNERETIERVCVFMDCKVKFYSMESNPLMLQVEITEMDGQDISNKTAWLLSRTIIWDVVYEKMKSL